MPPDRTARVSRYGWTLGIIAGLILSGTWTAARAQSDTEALQPVASQMLRCVDTVDGAPAIAEMRKNAVSRGMENEVDASIRLAKLQASVDQAIQAFGMLEAQLENDSAVAAMVRRNGAACSGLAILYLGHSSQRDQNQKYKMLFLVTRADRTVPQLARAWVAAGPDQPPSGPWRFDPKMLDANILSGDHSQVVLLPVAYAQMPHSRGFAQTLCKPDSTLKR